MFGDIIPVPQENYQLLYVSSDNTNHPAHHAYDNDTTSWWALYNSNGYSLPGIIHLDLSENHDVCGFSYLCNPASLNTRATDFEVYVSNDTLDWGTPQAVSSMIWADVNDSTRKDFYFGAVDGRYVRLVYLDNISATGQNVHTTDLVFFQDPGGATGQQNYFFSFYGVPRELHSVHPRRFSALATAAVNI